MHKSTTEMPSQHTYFGNAAFHFINSVKRARRLSPTITVLLPDGCHSDIAMITHAGWSQQTQAVEVTFRVNGLDNFIHVTCAGVWPSISCARRDVTGSTPIVSIDERATPLRLRAKVFEAICILCLREKLVAPVATAKPKSKRSAHAESVSLDETIRDREFHVTFVPAPAIKPSDLVVLVDTGVGVVSQDHHYVVQQPPSLCVEHGSEVARRGLSGLVMKLVPTKRR